MISCHSVCVRCGSVVLIYAFDATHSSHLPNARNTETAGRHTQSVRASNPYFNYLVVIQLHIIKHLIFCMHERRLCSRCLIYYFINSPVSVRAPLLCLNLSTLRWQRCDTIWDSRHHMHTLCTAKTQIFVMRIQSTAKLEIYTFAFEMPAPHHLLLHTPERTHMRTSWNMDVIMEVMNAAHNNGPKPMHSMH